MAKRTAPIESKSAVAKATSVGAGAVSTAAPLSLPLIGHEWPGISDSEYFGISTDSEGKPYAVVKVGVAPKRATYAKQMKWAKGLDADLISPAESLLAIVTIPDKLPKEWCWTNKLEGSSYAWYCYFTYGDVNYDYRSSEAGAVAVRRFPLDPSILQLAAGQSVVAEAL